MILDGQNVFSALDVGDSPTLVQDTASTNVIDQGVKSRDFNTPSGAYVAEFLLVRVHAAFTTADDGKIQIALQDSADNSSFADIAVGSIFAAANATINSVIFLARIPSSCRRYLRVAYRITDHAMTAGTVQAMLMKDTDIIDLIMRQGSGYITMPAGAMDASVNQGVLAQ